MGRVKSKNRLKPRQAIVKMEPYRPPSSGRGGKMRLDFNENTAGCSPRALKRLRGLHGDTLAVYPEYEAALPQLARHFRVSATELTLTNGTDEAIQLVVNTYINSGDRVLVPRPTYAMYRFYAQIMGAEVVEVDYPTNLSFPENELLRNLDSRTRAVFIANPNNPTGSSASPSQLRALLRAAPQAAVMVDEAYFEFSGQTGLPWINDHTNLFVSRTFSKAYGLAGLRVGCLFSSEDNIAAIRKGQSPYSVNVAAVAAALEAVRDRAFIKKYVAEVHQARALLSQELTRLGWRHFPSDANFLLVDFGKHAGHMRDILGENNILVRDRSYELPGCVRITVGTRTQTRLLLKVLERASRTISR
ncbi:MAG: histidinol-phosphate transaminase [Acidobacteria bacterium]|nr:histidinol-phosphate transaminase [Acidobacteriota bacterium]